MRRRVLSLDVVGVRRGDQRDLVRRRPHQDPAAAALAQAEDAIAKKDYAAAEGSLTQLTQQNPSNFQAWFDLGFVLNAIGKKDESIAAYR